MTNKLLPCFSLSLFGEGGGDGAGAAVSAAPDAGEQVRAQDSVQDAAAQESETNVIASTVQDRNAEFEKLIKGDYKEAFDSRVQNIINGRFKETRSLQEQIQKSAPILDFLAQRYGTKADDIDGLMKAIEDDDSYYQEEALEKGITVEQLKEMRKLERENRMLKQSREASEQQERMRRDLDKWSQEGEQLKEIYPTFDLRAELDNQEFFSLLRSNVPVRTAYEVMHRDEILGGAMQYAAQTAAKKVADSVAANGRRPVENAVTSQGAVASKIDVSKLTKAQCEEYERRAARGEKITF